ncbi:MAG TPA: hypothetical protein VIG24_14820, partial [Acidimicrobiia bacterium]
AGQERRQEAKAKVDKAVETGIVDEFLDESKPTYAPKQALDALRKHVNKQAPTAEVVAAGQATVQALEAQKATYDQALGIKTPEDLQALESKAIALRAKVDDQGLKGDIVEGIAELEGQLKSLKQLNEQILEAENLTQTAAERVRTNDQDPSITLEEANQAPSPASTAAAASVVTLAMNAPQSLDLDAVEALVANTDNALPAEGRELLDATVKSRRATEAFKGLKGVRQDIMTGSEGFRGLEQYESSFASAKNSGNTTAARTQYSGLASFAKSRETKRAAVQSAFNEVWGTDKEIYLLRGEDNAWQRVDSLTPEQEASSRSLKITQGSGRLADSITQEAEVLDMAARRMKLALDMPAQTSEPAPQADAEPGPTPAPETAPEPVSDSEASARQQAPIDDLAPADADAAIDVDAPVRTQVDEDVAVREDSQEDLQAEAEQQAEVLADFERQERGDPAPTEEAETAEAQPEAGRLSAFENAEAPKQDWTAEDYSLLNHLTQFFRQKEGRADSASVRPLVAVKDFLTQFRDGKQDLSRFLDKPLTNDDSEQLVSIKMFMSKAAAWNESLTALLPPKGSKRKEFYSQSPIHYFMDENGQIDENVKTAISYAAYTWLAENAGKTYNDAATINAMMGQRDDKRVPKPLMNLLGDAGQFTNMVHNSLGQRIVQTLGMEALAHAPVEAQARMEATLGFYAVRLLEAEGLVETHEILSEKLASFRPKKHSQVAEQSRDFETTSFVRFPHTKDASGLQVLDTEVESELRNIKSDVSQSQGVLAKLFGAEDRMKQPSLEPVPFDQKAVKGQQGVPKALGVILADKGQKANTVRNDMWNGVQKLPNVLERIAGITGTNYRHHNVNQMAHAATNDGLRLELDNFFEFMKHLPVVDDGGFASFFFGHEVWRPQRVGIDSQLVNPLQSKIHRFMVGMEGWAKPVPTDINGDAFTHFHVAIAQGLGIDIDKQDHTSALTQLRGQGGEGGLLNDPKIQAAVQHLHAATYQDADLSDAVQITIAEAVEMGGQAFHSLDALMNLAHHQEAMSRQARRALGETVTGPEPTTYLVGEVDGVANGPMLAFLGLGSIDSVTLAQGGFFQEGSADENYNVWRGQPGNSDLYETVAKTMTRYIRRMGEMDPKVAEVMPSIYAITGTIVDLDGEVGSAGRKMVKKATTPLVYGTSSENAVADMATKFIESYYGKIEAIANDSDVDQEAELQQLTDAVNSMLEYHSPFGWKKNELKHTSIEGALAQELTYAQETSLKEVFASTVGEGIKGALEDNFALFLERRSVLTDASNLAFALHNGVTKGLEANAVKELAEQGRVLMTKKGIPLHGLPLETKRAIDDRLEKVAPFVATALSEGDSGSGIYVPKTEMSLSPTLPYLVQPQVADSSKDSGAAAVRVHAMSRAPKEPGVAMGVLLTHSTDSAISHWAHKLKALLQVHDAHIGSFAELVQIAKDLNEATFNVMLEYSAPMAAFDMFGQTVMGLSDMAGEVDVAEILKTLPLQDGQSVTDALRETWAAAHEATQDKLTAMSKMAYVSQYAYEGGSYVVTDANRERAQELLEALSEKMPSDLEAAAWALDRLRDADAETRSTAEPSPEVVDERPAPVTQSPARPREAQALDTVIQTSEGVVKEAATDVRRAMLADNTNVGEAVRKASDVQMGARVREQVAQQVNAQSPRMTPHGETGVSKILSDPRLEGLFLQKGERTAKEMLHYLGQRLEQAQRSTPSAFYEFQKQLMHVLRGAVDPDLVIQYVTPETPVAGMEDVGLTKARGSYSTKHVPGGRIYVKSSEFKHSGLTNEVLLHELTHAALARKVAGAQNDADHPASPYVSELERLREKAADVIAADPELAEFATEFPVLDETYRKAQNMTKADLEAAKRLGVQELISWGMTNRRFQDQVLSNSKLSIASKTRKQAKLLTGVQTFIKTVTQILFGGQKAKDSQFNGMRALVDNVSGLFAEQTNGPDAGGDITLAQNATDPLRMTNDQVLDALADPSNPSSPDSLAQLKRLLGEITQKVHGPFGAEHAKYASDPALTRADRFAQVLATGEARFASKTLNSSIVVNEQEAFVLEQVEASVAAGLNNTFTAVASTVVNAQLRRIFLEAKKVLTPAHFEQAFGVDAATAQVQYDFVFTAEREQNGSTEALSRFAALGLVVPKFRDLLDFNTYKSQQRFRDLNWKGRLKAVFNKILDLFTGKALVANDQDPAKVQLGKLIDQLVRIETDRKTKLMRKPGVNLEKLEAGLRSVGDKTRSAIEKGGRSKLFKDSSSGFIKAVGSLSSAVAGDRVAQVLDEVQRVRDQAFEERQGATMAVVSETLGLKGWLMDLMTAATRNEQKRKAIKDGLAKISLAEFEGELTKADKADISVALRADLPALLGPYTLDEIQALMASPQALEKAIQTREAQARALNQGQLYVRQAKDLGYHMSKGLARNANLHLNIHTMSRLHGEFVAPVSETDAKAAEAILDPLVSLYALRYTRQGANENVAAIMQREAARQDGNGMEFTLLMYKQLVAESKERLFQNSEALMIKGYTPELYNEGVEVKVANEVEGKLLVAQGFSQHAVLANDPSDPDQSVKHIYVLGDRGLQSYNTGATSFSEMASRGEHSKVHQGLFSAQDGTPHRQNSRIHAAVHQKKRAAMARRSLDPSYDPAKAQEQNHMVPIFNPSGQIVNYRYMMSQDLKDQVMKRDNDFSKMLGSMSGTTFDKVASVEQNEGVFKALLEQYQEEGNDRPQSYLEVGPNASDPELKEYWHMLPRSSQELVKKIWGENRLFVRTDHIDMIFGYRKYSLSNVWNKMSKKEAKKLRLAGIDPNNVERSLVENLFA